MRLSSDQFAQFVDRANLAPSVHNTQLTRWHLDDDGTVIVLEDASRRLPVADPHGRDAAVSHGAAVEGFAIACADAGGGLDVERIGGNGPGGLALVARLTLAGDTPKDPLAPYVATRRSYRGAFAKKPAPAGIGSLESAGDVTLVRTPSGIARIAAMNDAGSMKTYRDGPYRAELREWLRLSRKHPRWSLDGLNAEEMAMSPIAATGAGIVLGAGTFETLDRIGIASPLVAEAAVVKSSKAVALFHRPADEDPFVTGRRFYRVWLEFEAAGVAAAPMSVLADDDDLRAAIAREFGIAPDRRLINGFRLGVPPERKLGPKPRLPRAALVV